MGSSPPRSAPLAHDATDSDLTSLPRRDGEGPDHDAGDGPAVDVTAPVTSQVGASHRGPLDDLAHRVLRLGDAEPRALLDLQGSLVVSAVRCLLAYVVVPIALPLIAWADVVATPLSLVLSLLAIVLSVRSLRRIWQAQWTHRLAYTGFIMVVVGLLLVTVVVDVASLLS